MDLGLDGADNLGLGTVQNAIGTKPTLENALRATAARNSPKSQLRVNRLR